MTFFGNTDLTTLDWLTKRMGQTEITVSDTSTSQNRANGESQQTGSTATEGSAAQEGLSQGANDMAPMNTVATVQGGQTFWELLLRRTARTIAPNWSRTSSNTSSTSTANSDSTTTSTSLSEGQTVNRRTQAVPLMSPQEIASFFDREEGRMIAFLGGYGPYAVARTPYFEDPMFKGLVG